MDRHVFTVISPKPKQGFVVRDHFWSSVTKFPRSRRVKCSKTRPKNLLMLRGRPQDIKQAKYLVVWSLETAISVSGLLVQCADIQVQALFAVWFWLQISQSETQIVVFPSNSCHSTPRLLLFTWTFAAKACSNMIGQFLDLGAKLLVHMQRYVYWGCVVCKLQQFKIPDSKTERLDLCGTRPGAGSLGAWTGPIHFEVVSCTPVHPQIALPRRYYQATIASCLTFIQKYTTMT